MFLAPSTPPPLRLPQSPRKTLLYSVVVWSIKLKLRANLSYSKLNQRNGFYNYKSIKMNLENQLMV